MFHQTQVNGFKKTENAEISFNKGMISSKNAVTKFNTQLSSQIQQQYGEITDFQNMGAHVHMYVCVCVSRF